MLALAAMMVVMMVMKMMIKTDDIDNNWMTEATSPVTVPTTRALMLWRWSAGAYMHRALDLGQVGSKKESDNE